MRILLTGASGFIGMHVAERLLARGDEVIGVDNLNDYYDVTLKEARLARLKQSTRFRFNRVDVANVDGIAQLFTRERPQRVVHLAAQAGVRYSLKNPHAYITSNVVGFTNVLEGCRRNAVEHLVYASSSSVYGGNEKMPFSEEDSVDHPVSLYAATKKSNELMAHCYSHLYGLPTTGLRFFTVYGPWGRPDMALFLFTKAILAGEPINVFNYGRMRRDFTYVDDIVEGVLRVLDRPARPDETFSKHRPKCSTSWAPYRVLNIGNNRPIELMTYIRTLESALDRKARLNMLPLQDGDVPATYANTDALHDLTGFTPSTSVEAGIAQFVAWYREYFAS